MKKFILSFLLLVSTVVVVAQSERPTWVNGYHRDLNNSYIDVFSATERSESSARSAAIQQIVDERSRATGRRYSVRESNGNITMNSQDELTVKCRIIDEYHKPLGNGMYKVYLLVQTAKHPDYTYESVTVSNSYPVSARIIIPGWTQIYKGQTVKGVLMLGGVVAGGIGTVLCESQRSDYKNKIKQQPQFAKDYNTKASNWETARNICIGATAAIYLYSIIDGIAAKGARRVIVKKANGNNLSFHPVATPYSAGAALTYNF